MEEYAKESPAAPPGFFAAEAAGLAWLAAPAAVPVVGVLDVREDRLLLERLESVPPTAAAARAFGRGLAALHAAGAEAFGAAPSERLWFGPLDAPFEVSVAHRGDFRTYWAQDRLAPLAAATADALDAAGRRAVEEALASVRAGAFDGIAGGPAEAPSRVHGDLWAGNVLFAAGGATLIDPSAHGGHRLEDLALLALFGAPHLEEIFAGYEAAAGLPSGWRQDLPAHLFFALLAHVRLFGGGYARQAVRTAEAIVARARALGF